MHTILIFIQVLHKGLNTILYIKCIVSVLDLPKFKHFTIPLSSADLLDIKLKVEKNRVTAFSLNYRTKIGEDFFQIYRVDTSHGFLHEQRFWITPEPIPIPKMGKELKEIFEFYLDLIKNNYRRYRKYYKERMKPG